MERPETGTLFVVATPIGNLEDITLRALRTLKEVTIVAAEDTRRTRNLLRHYEIRTPLISLHEHNEHTRKLQMVRRLVAGESVALVSDAGTPGISDPGAAVVQAAREAGVRVEPIPGPSAVIAALSASGLSSERFAFAGFPPIRSNDRNKYFEWLATLGELPIVLFEAPHRLHKTLGDLRHYLVNRPIIVARELTKVHEEWVSAHDADLVNTLKSPRGEFVLIVGPSPVVSNAVTEHSDAEIAAVFGQITESTERSRRDAIKLVSERLSLPSRVVYSALERQKNLVK